MNEPGRHKKLSALLLLLLVGLVLVFAVQRVVQRRQPVPVRAVPPLAVEVVTPQPASFVVTRRYVGSVEAARSVALTARISSRVTAVHHREGERVSRGELLISLDDAEQRNEIRRLLASGRRLRAEYAYWKNQYQRSIRLLKERAIAESAHDEALRMKKSLEASLEENTVVLARARLELGYTQIRAPFNARIQKVLTDVGATTLKYSRVLMELVSSDAFKAMVTVPQADLGRIRPGQPVRLRLPALDLLQHGRIQKIHPVLDPSTRNVTFEAWLVDDGRDEPDRIHAGMMVEATVVLQEYDAVLTIPRQALIKNRLDSGVFVVADGKARWSRVQAGESAGGRVRIRDGLRAGVQVIVTPDPRLRDGVAVKVIRGTPASAP